MKKRPLSITIIALLYLLEPIGNIGFAAWANNLPVFGPAGVLAHLIWSDWLVLALFPLVAAGIFMVRPWGWYLFLTFSVALIAYNLIVHFYLNPNYGFPTVLVFIVIISAVSALFLRRHVQAPYFNPRLRWWEVASRFRVNLQARLSTNHHGPLCVQLLDISTTGCFVDYHGPLQVGESAWLLIRCAHSEISCLGTLVRQAVDGTGIIGYGIMFQAMSPEIRQRLEGLMASLEQLGGRDRKGTSPAGRIPPDFDLHRRPLLRRIARRVAAAV
jgi:hypothetical protein